MKTRIAVAALFAPLTFLSACRAQSHMPGQSLSALATPAATEQTTFYSVGVVTSTNPKFPSVEIEHEEIKGLMPAMTMEFYVSDKAMLNDLKPGDRISFTMTNGVGGLKITEIKKR